jgi:hypothetical protein
MKSIMYESSTPYCVDPENRTTVQGLAERLRTPEPTGHATDARRSMMAISPLAIENGAN